MFKVIVSSFFPALYKWSQGYILKVAGHPLLKILPGIKKGLFKAVLSGQ
jgi:hypothetical protein